MVSALNVISKGVGLVAAGGVLYNSHLYGREVARKNQIEHVSERLPEAYLQANRLESINPITLDLKRYFYRKDMDSSSGELQAGISGYVKGFVKGTVDNILPLALGVGALMYKRVGKACALGLGIMGLAYWRWDIVGHGKAGLMDE